MTETRASTIFVAGIRDENSLGMSAAQAWLDRDPNNEVLTATRSDTAREFVEGAGATCDGRLQDMGTIDWADNRAYSRLNDMLGERFAKGTRPLAGLVHAIAGADLPNFREPAHELEPEVFTRAFVVSAVSLLQVIKGAREFLAPNAGVVTFGFGRPGVAVEGYGGAMGTAKRSLSHMAVEFAYSLGGAVPKARVLEIVTGYLETYSGKAVAMMQVPRVRPKVVAANFAETSALAGASGEEQRLYAGVLAADFIANPAYGQTTGQTLYVDAGWGIMGQRLFPKTPPEK